LRGAKAPKQSRQGSPGAGLLRSARNDGPARAHTRRHCEARSDEAIQTRQLLYWIASLGNLPTAICRTLAMTLLNMSFFIELTLITF
jgi:hypothetical protein